MNRAQFMDQLEKLLSDIQEAERLEALDYYESYFDDAGSENEAAVIRELGSPGKVAAIIKADLRESNDSYAEYTERGYEDLRTREPDQVPGRYTGASSRRRASGQSRHRDAQAAGDGSTAGTQSRFEGQSAGQSAGPEGEENSDAWSERSRRRAERGYHAEKKKNNGVVILVLILLVFASPFLKGAVGGIIGLIVGIVLLPFLLVFALGAAAVGLIAGGVAAVVAGIGSCIAQPAVGVLSMGIGCILIALGILFLMLIVWIAGKLLPKLIRTFTDFCGNIIHRERKGEERV